ncbi:non-ribosomal peptide synthase/polyketide synthase, partial [Corallococcus sicarius]
AQLVPLSARSPEALRALARDYLALGPRGPSPLESLGFSAATRRGHQSHRAALLATTWEELQARLQALAEGQPHPGVATGPQSPGSRPRVAFVFSGQGPQWFGMARALLAQEPVFRQVVEQCDALLKPLAGWSILEELAAEEGRSRLSQTEFAQPVMFSLQVGLAALWRSLGVEPDQLVGHSAGEVAAACVAGALSLSQALEVILHRGRVTQQASGRGRMALLELAPDEAARLLAGYEGRLAIAARNGPTSTIVSGDVDALTELLGSLEQRQVHARLLAVNFASHCHHMDPAREAMREALRHLRPSAPTVPMVSTVSALPVEGAVLDGEYWARQLREPVRFADTMERLVDSGCGLFVEVAPHPLLLADIAQLLRVRGLPGVAVPSMRRGEDERAVLLGSLGALYAQGVDMSWSELFAKDTPGVPLPTYPWQRERCWVALPQGGAATPTEAPELSEDWFYGTRWEPAAPAPAVQVAARWLLLGDTHGTGAALAERLRQQGQPVMLVEPGEGGLDAAHASDEALARVLDTALGQDARSPLRVVYLRALDGVLPESADLETVGAALALGCVPVVSVLRTLLSRQPADARLWLVTRGAQPVGDGPHALETAQATLWGLSSTLASEHPELWGGMVDLDPAASAEEGSAALCEALQAGDGEDRVALRQGRRFVERMVRRQELAASRAPLRVRADGTYLVTGGLGGLGAHVARWLVQQGARRLILLGRTPLPPRSKWKRLEPDAPQARQVGLVRELEALGASVHVASVDVGDGAALAQYLETFRDEGWPELRGVIHAAGVLLPQEQPVAQMDARPFDTLLRPKALGGWLLHRLLRDTPLDFFVSFSSVSAYIGSPGQAPYSAANAFLAALAHLRHAAGLPALTIDWGTFAEAGMAARLEQGRRITGRGLRLMEPEQALPAIAPLLAAGEPVAGVMDIRWSVLRQVLETRGERRVLALLADTGPEAALPVAASGPQLRATLLALDGSARADALTAFLRGEAGTVLGLPPEKLDVGQPLGTLGFDSIMSVDLRNRIQARLQVTIPIVELVKGPSLTTLTSRLLTLLAADPGAAHAEGSGSPPLRRLPDESPTHPLSYAQERMWFIQQLEPGNIALNVPLLARFRGLLEPQPLGRIFTELLRRHEALRTTFATVDGRPLQVVAEPFDVQVPCFDLRTLPPEAREAAAHERVMELSRQTFDLEKGPILRLALFQLADDTSHVLMVMHHIMTDGWSLVVLASELGSLVEAASRGRVTPLPELPVRYSDFARWQRQWLQGDALESQLAWWKARLAGVPDVLELPTDRPRPTVPSRRGERYALRLSRPLTQGLKALSQQEGATLFMTLLAGFQVLLHRYSGQDDFCVGSPTAGRSRSELEGLVGFFLNTLVLRASFQPALSFRELVAQVREVALGAYAHQDVPFDRLVEALKPTRTLSHAPLFQVLFILHRAHDASILTGALTDVEDIHFGATLYDLNLSFMEDEHGLKGWLEYSADLFDEATIARMAAHLQVVLEGAVADPGQRITHLPLLTPPERQQLLVDWNATRVDFPTTACFPQLFEQQAARAPDAVALVCEERQLTYRELNARANRLAHLLVAEGVGPDMPVGLLGPRGIDFVTALLAILKAGGTYLPMDPAHPPHRIAQVLEQSLAPRVLVAAELASTLEHACELLPTPVARPRGLVLEDALAQPGPDVNLPARAGPGHLAYIIYTSGSTGVPKGAMLEHAGLLNHLYVLIQEMALSERDGVAQTASQSFDISVWQFLTALMLGGRTHLLLNDVVRSPPRLLQEMQAQGLTIVQVVPSVLRVMLEEAEALGPARPALESLRWMIPTGEALPPEVSRKWFSLYPRIPLLNAYGPAECSDDVTLHVLRQAPTTVNTPIGRVVANLQLYLLDRAGQPVPLGVPGEIHIGGVGVGRGYLNDARRTAEQFLPDPFRGEPGARFYRTGDLGRFLRDGTIEFLGRVDHQVKVRGFRIELGEIELALERHAAVLEAVVVAREDVPGSVRLVGYVAPRAGQTLDSGEVRAFIKERLPEYMVPPVLVVLEALPRSPNGKVDRKSLPVPTAGAVRQREFVAPRTALEQQLAQMWVEVLRVERVGLHDDFFELGGHSLLTTQVLSRIRKAFQVELPLRELFDASTVAALAARVEVALGDTRTSRPPPLTRVSREGRLVPSFAQQRLLFIDQLQPDSPLYNIPSAVLLEGLLDTDALERALAEVRRRHESLRTTFHVDDAGPRQHITSDAGLPLARHDLRHLPPSERMSEALRLASREAQRPFALDRGPLVRAALLQLEPACHVLTLTMHHIVSDGGSMLLLVREVAALYEAFRAGQPSPLPELSVQYTDFAHWQRQWLQGGALESQLDWWRQELQGVPQVLELPTDRPRPRAQSFRGAAMPVHYPRALSDSVRAFSQREGVTPFMLLMAAFQVLLHRYSGQADFCVGSPTAGRNVAETEGLIGFFVNNLVLRVRLGGDPTFRELLAQVRETTLGAFAHQELPFERLVEALQPVRDLTRSPLFQTVFVLQQDVLPELKLPGLSLRPLTLEQHTAKFDLLLSLTDTADGLVGSLEYGTDLFDGATAARMVEHLHQLLLGILADPSRRISRLPLLAQAERHRLLREWSGPRASSPASACVHHQFEALAARTPDAVAVTFEDTHLSYGELNARANRLAWRLRGLGVGPETLVGLCVERSLEMVVGILGILKAGGAYVPLDPAYPRERLAFMLEDSRVPVLLTQQALVATLPEHTATVLCLDAAPEPASERQDNPVSGVTSEHLAYVIYTSGSTGKPKGAQLAHGRITRLFSATQPWFHFGANDVWTLFHSYAFDFSVWELWGALIHGGRLVVVPYWVSRSPEAFHALLKQERVTVLNQTPSAFRQLIQVDSATSGPSGLALRNVIFGGEALEFASLRPWFARHPDTRPRLVNMYGITETTVHVTYRPLRAEDAQGTTGSIIGVPIPDLQLYVLDAHLQPAPIGVPGELYVGGMGLARGYLARPALTAERFIPDPFSDAPGARLYKSGDRARYLVDGSLEYLGRGDFQVKLRGFRIELGEIEAALAQHGSLREAAVLVREDSPGHKRLVAYAVPAPGAALDVEALRAHLKARLPEYMVPAAFVSLTELPLTSHGKLDRGALPAPEQAVPEAAFVAPVTPVEQTLAALWAQVLGVVRVGLSDNFFALGGDSILSLQVIARAQRAGLRLTPRQLFQHQTVAELARVVETTAAPRAEQGLVTGEVPPTPIQRAFFEWEFAQPHHYNQAVLLEAPEPLDAATLEQALQALVEHHDALRTRALRGDQGWTLSQVGLDAPVRLERLDAGASGASLERETARVQASLSLESGLLLGAALFEPDAGQPQRLLLYIHHLAVDGVSWRVLLEDLDTAYGQLARGERVALPPKTTPFLEWARRLQQHALTPRVEQELAYWRTEGRRPVPALPVEREGQPQHQATSRRVVVRLDAARTRTLLQEVPTAYRSRIDEVLLAALARALTRWTGSESLRVDLEGHGREDLFEDVDLSRTVGWFTALYPVVLQVPAGASPATALRAVRDSLRRVPGRGLGHGLLRHLGPDAVREQLRALPAAPVAFNYLGQFDAVASGAARMRPSRESAGPTRSGLGQRTHLLEVNGLVLGGELELEWIYSEAVHTHATVEALAQELLTALRELIEGRDSEDARRYTPGDFPLADVSPAVLGTVLPAGEPVEDVYRLTPMQQGMLFQTLLEPGAGAYFEQLSWSLHSGLDVAAFRQAWQAVVDRHPALRTRFHWEGLAEPLQVVLPRAELPWSEEDLRGLSPAEQQARLSAWLEADRTRGFELSRAPLLRLTLLRLDAHVYRCVWSFHHLIQDGWSMGLLLQDVFSAYAALLAGQPPRLGRAPAFRDYVEWLGRQDLTRTEAWWRKTFAGFLAPTPLPGDERAGALRDRSQGRSGMVELLLPEGLTEALQGFARQHQLTLNTLVQGAWALLLGRHTHLSDVVFGATVAGRPPGLSTAADTVGLFINTVPVRVTLPAGERLLPWLRRIQAQQAEAQEHEHSPLVQVQGWSGVPRGTPLFETLLVFENYPVDDSVRARAGGLDVRDVRFDERPHYALNVTVIPDRQLRLKLAHDTSRLTRATVERLAGHWRTLLEGLVARPGQRLGDLPLLTDGERRQLLTTWNDTHSIFPAGCVHHLFEAQVERTPDAEAVRQGEARLTYGELERRANQLAHHLRARGVGPGVLVGLYVERTVEMAVGLLGILKAGGAYVPLDPGYPVARLASMLEDSAVPVLVTQERLADELPAGAFQTVCLDADRALVARERDTRPVSSVTADDLAYVIYTSGSTGRPKGVLIEHRGVVNYLAWCARAYPAAEGAAPVHSSLAFDLTVTSLLLPLTVGRAVVLVEEGGVEGLARVVREGGGYGLVKLTPSHLQLLARQLRPEEARGGARAFVIGGEALTAEHLTFWREHAPATRLINEYGPTETVVGCCVHEVTADAAPGSVVSIGRPIANVDLHVLDADLRLVPVGVAGELYIGGVQLARGYWRRPDLTAERFIPHPFSWKPGARLYRTGDRVRRNADGTLEFLGRLDSQVKVRGYRIELGEVEALLAACPGVSEAAVVTREDGSGSAQLVAYVTGDVDAARLRQTLAEQLPAYMVPSAFIRLDALPLTPNGKVDSKALAGLGLEAGPREPTDTFRAPRTPTEQLLAGIWEQVLRVERVGLGDDFFDLGGHSLLATQLVSRIQGTFQVELPLGDIFEAPTLTALAERIAQQAHGEKPPALERLPRTGDLPLSFAQQRLWFLDQLEPDSAAYNISSALLLEGALDVDALEKGLGALLSRHEALRGAFPEADGRPVLRLAPDTLPLALRVEDLGHLPAEGRLDAALRQAAEDARKPFVLAEAPLLRALLLRLESGRHVLALTVHHIVADGASMAVLVRELSELYEAFRADRSPALPGLPVQYADFAHWQRQWLQGPVLEAQLDWWREQLRDMPQALELPTDRPRPAAQSFRGAAVPVRLPVELTQELHAFCRREGVTPFMVLLAAFQVLLHRHSGQEDVGVGSPIAGRTRSETEGLIGFFVNTLVLRARMGGDPTFRELLAQVRRTALGAYSHQDLPFEQLVDAVRPERDLSRSPLFQVMFVLDQDALAGVQLPGLSLKPLSLERDTAKFDLTLALADTADGLVGSLEYSTDLFDAATVARLAGHLETLLRGILATPDQHLSRLPLLSEAEQHQLVSEWNDTRLPREAGLTLHGLIEAQVERTPEAVAVTFDGEHLTYRQLDARANQVAHALRERGVGPEARVALLMERSVELVVGLLGILKAGGAYVPLEPTLPQERLRSMLRDSEARLVLTQERHAPLLPGDAPAALCLDTGWSDFAKHAQARPDVTVHGAGLAYVIFTSGSTGQPKGAMNTHEALCNRLLWMQEAYGLTAEDRVLQKTPYGFDVSVWEFFWPLMTGARLVVARPGGHQDSAYLTRIIVEQGITTLHFVPSMLRAFLEEPGVESCTGLRRIVCSGEALPADLQIRCLERLPAQLHNLYGPTEAAVDVTAWACARGDTRTSVPIGRPISNVYLRVLGPRLELVPPGAVGELFLGGIALARGYAGRPGLTAERFVPDPLGATPGARLYKTGDRVRYLADGSLEYLGRTDFQVKLRGFRIELGEIEAVLASHAPVRQAAVLVREDVPGQKRLVAYVVPASEPMDEEALRAVLKAHLPEYMVPSAFVSLPALPLSSNGKLDRRALPAPGRAASGEDFLAPRTPMERTLADIWAQVLGLARVGTGDNFFTLGGDSILGLQVVSRARRAGLRLTARQLFQHQTVAELARAAGDSPLLQAEQGLVTGEVPLTPIQHWFLEQPRSTPHHFNQAVLLEILQPLDAALLERALGQLLLHHDALRMRFQSQQGWWTQHLGDAQSATPALTREDLSALPADARPAALERIASQAQARLHLSDGPLLRAVWFDAGPTAPGHLLLVIHHLVVDGVSWRVLLEDLDATYTRLREGFPPALPPKSTSFKAWAERLHGHARSDTFARLPAWLDLPAPTPLPVDAPGGLNTLDSERRVAVSLTAGDTQLLVQEVPGAYGARLEEVLLAALTHTLARWSGQSHLMVDLEGHGREDLFEDVDLSRTVGWFTTLFPLLVDVDASHGPAAALRQVRHALRAVPDKGLGYGLLHYLRPRQDARPRSSASGAPVLFNYLGQLDSALPSSPHFRLSRLPTGPVQGGEGPRTHVLEVTAFILGGRLEIAFAYSQNLHQEGTLQGLGQHVAQTLRALVSERHSPQALARTAADFPLAGVPTHLLDALLQDQPALEDVYPLAPMQRGLLFHALLAPGSSAYFEQLSWAFFNTALDPVALQRAWEHLLARHPVLRTGFLWEGLEQPLQLVHAQSPLPWQVLDWRALPDAEQSSRFQAFLAEDRARGFDLTRPPLMRLALIQLAGDTWRLVWSFHHLLVDGWSIALVLKELFATYSQLASGQLLARAAPAHGYRDYVAWLQGQEPAKAEAFWRATLAGVSAPTALPEPLPGEASDSAEGSEREVALSEEDTAAMQAFARKHQLTLNTLVQAAWALVLAHHAGGSEAVFGATRSGRPAALANVESAVGLFINTLPVRVALPAHARVGPWLRELQARQLELADHEHTLLADIQAWSGVPRGTSLFESILVVENYPVDASLKEGARHLDIRDPQSFSRTNYPLTAVAIPQRELRLRLVSGVQRLGPATLERLLTQWRAALAGLTASADSRLGDVTLLSPDERHRMLVTWNDSRVDFTQDTCAHHLFEAQVALTPDAPALECQGTTLSYRELDSRANQLAHHLLQSGVGPDVRVALCCERSPELITGMLGILKAGGAFVPLEPSHPAERLAFVVKDSGATVLLTQKHLVPPGTDTRISRVLLDEDWGAIARQPTHPPASRVLPDHLAYVIYTSGSTGRPKGTLLHHRGLSNTAQAAVLRHGFAPASRVLQ